MQWVTSWGVLLVLSRLGFVGTGLEVEVVSERGTRGEAMTNNALFRHDSSMKTICQMRALTP